MDAVGAMYASMFGPFYVSVVDEIDHELVIFYSAHLLHEREL